MNIQSTVFAETGTNDSLYDDLALHTEFSDLADPNGFNLVAQDWLIGVADVVDSTSEIAAGRYKTVNMVGAAVISAVINTIAPKSFPFVFSGDGAGFAVWPGARDQVAAALAAVQVWSRREFGIRLRVALVPVCDAMQAGHSVRIARYRPAPGVDYAMFAGGGLTWAEEQMKAGRYTLPAAPEDIVPDLTGLSCRWSKLQARHGSILSVVVVPGTKGSETDFADLTRSILQLGNTLDRDGHPVPVQGPEVQYPPPGITLEAQASHGKRSVLRRKVELLAQNLFAWVLFRTGTRLGQFDPEHYRAEVASNVDFRKFDDGLKMTLDCDADTRDRIKTLLASAQDRGLVRYGLYEQDEALVTCFVPSPMQNDHIHFIDGAGGGYTQAAAQIKTG